ncbi:hypothetical protein FDG2_0634 [Candidatus Protofrankia californiensis]|uniref:Uncharacterized protein n=2 Tax=Protofrankia TaxID=2994361 RepID=A0A1C3NU05_9ACTN|nr:hypothetical protein FDG2_0634 [Candidatus Protofrankia californiensis]
MRALIRRAPDLALAMDPPPYRPHLTIRSLAALPVRLSS